MEIIKVKWINNVTNKGRNQEVDRIKMKEK